MMDVKRYPRESLRDEKGMVLVVALLLISVLLLLGTTAVMTSTTDMKISTNYKTVNQAFYAAEAGLNEMKARLKRSLPADKIITDPNYPDPKWTSYILTTGMSLANDHDSSALTTASYKNYIPHSSSQTSTSVQSNTLQTATPIILYCVRVKHKTEYDAEIKGHTTTTPHYVDLDGNTGGHTLANPGNIVYYGYRNASSSTPEYFTSSTNPPQSQANPVEIIMAYGSASGGSVKVIQVEVTRPLPVPVPAALYVEAATTIQGTSTHVNGTDQCGGASKPGIVTTLATSTVGTSGNPVIKGSTSPTGTPLSVVSNPAGNLDVQAMIDSLKGDADYKYGLPNTSVAGATHSGMTWGTPTPNTLGQDYPSTCSEHHIVYYNTSNGTNLTDIKLSGGSQGCGILLVEGDLEAQGGFNWNGIVIVSGSVRITGGGNKNITGGIVVGGSADADLVGGNVSVVYCSTAVNSQTENNPLRNLSWMEQM
jgi:Tfp pilus assembly protein PilX